MIALKVAAGVFFFFGLRYSGIARRRRSFRIGHCEAWKANDLEASCVFVSSGGLPGNCDGMTTELLHGVVAASARRVLARLHCGSSHARELEAHGCNFFSRAVAGMNYALRGIMLYAQIDVLISLLSRNCHQDPPAF